MIENISMANRKYQIATQDEMKTFVSNLGYWCNCHAENCYSCENITQCTGTPTCLPLKLNFSENTYSRLSDNLNNQPSAKTIRDYYRNWKNQGKRIKKTAIAQVLFKYLQDFKNNPYSDDSQLQKYKDELKEMYSLFLLKEGCQLSATALEQYPFHIDIIRWWTLFHNRSMKWEYVRETLLDKISNSNDDAVKAECFLGIFEGCINEYTKNRHKLNAFEKFQEDRIKYLDSVPNKETNGKYYYFLTRFLEEEWWKLPDHAKPSSTIIFHAIININRSIELYGKESSGYPAIDIKPWWLYCHKAMLLKLWEHEEFPESLNQYGEIILKEIEINPTRKSTQMYAITYYILHDNLKKLSSFLEKLSEILRQSVKISSVSVEENRITTVDNLTYHYVELLFYADKAKQNKYHKVITTWFQKNTH